MTEQQISEMVAGRCGVPPDAVRVSARPLRGGLECDVRHVRLQVSGTACQWPSSVIVKELRGRNRRERHVYELLQQLGTRHAAPELMAVESAAHADYLFLSDAGPAGQWPWAETAAAAAVCGVLAALHEQAVPSGALDDWDYERELHVSAEETLALVLAVGRRYWPRVGDLRRVVRGLPAMRQLLLAGETTLIHGDVHPGNVLLSADADRHVVLIDWGRARRGSPLEDVASWLQALGAWEPQARRFHDTLLRAYLIARRRPSAIDEPLRTQYWFAGASNGLAGAIRYHVAVSADPNAEEWRRADAGRALVAWRRVIRQAAERLA